MGCVIIQVMSAQAQLSFSILTGLAGTAIALGTMFLVLWQAPGQRRNQLMAAYLLSLALWGIAALGIRLAVVSGQTPEPYFHAAAWQFGLGGWLLLGLALYEGQQHPNRWLVASGLIVMATLTIVFVLDLQGRSYQTLTIAPDGSFTYQATLPGQVAWLLRMLPYLLAVVILWHARQKISLDFFWGGCFIALGGLLGRIFNPLLPAFSPAFMATIGAILFTRSILRQNLFNPLLTLNQQLAESEARYRVVSELTSDYAYAVRVAANGRLQIEWITEAFTRITGYTATDVEAFETWRQLVHPNDQEIALERERALVAGHGDVREYRICTKDGQVRWVREYGQPIMSEDGQQLQRVLGAGQDVTERRQAEEALVLSENKHRVLLDSIVQPTLALTPDMTIYYCNQAYADLVDSQAEALTGQNLIELFPMFAQTKSYTAYFEAMRSGRAMEAEGKIGERYWLSHISPAPWGVIAIAEDVTARRQAEEALAMANMKSELLTKVSHELRTPLNAILGYAEILQSGSSSHPSDRQAEYLSRIIFNTEKLIAHVNGMLDQAQIELGQLFFNVGPFTPHHLLQDVHAVLDVLAEQKGLQLTSEVSPAMPPKLQGDFERLRQILVNLAGNAVKFTAQGSVHICLEWLDADHWMMQVRDTGPGISETAQVIIFDAFRQAHPMQTREYGGVGLGLSIVRQLVTLMGGEIRLESRLEHGSTFQVILPFTPVEEPVA